MEIKPCHCSALAVIPPKLTLSNFGKIETSTTGLLHLLLAEFGLIYSNDWFMLPHPRT